MGNCVFRGSQVEEGDDVDEMVRVVTSNGGVMELSPPITAESITNELPGHAIFQRLPSPDRLFSRPLLHTEELLPGQLYYLLPAQHQRSCSSSVPMTPYRMSLDNQGKSKKLPSSDYSSEVLPRYHNTRSGVWKVKLVISPEQLSEILSHEARTGELIESVRTVAKCGNSVPSSVANSDQWSLSSGNHWKSSSGKFGTDVYSPQI